MRSKWKRLLLTTMAVGMLSSVTAFAANVSMNLRYNGKNHAYNAPEIKVTGATSTTQMTGHSYTSKLKPTSNLYK